MYKINYNSIINFLKINFFISLLVWFISKINIYFITQGNNDKSFLITNGIIYTYVLLFLIIILKKRKKNERIFNFIVITSIYIINIGLLFNLTFVPCDGIVVTQLFKYSSLFILTLNLLITSIISYKNNSNLMSFFYPLLLSALHFTFITFTFYLNYLVFYEMIFEKLISLNK